MGLLCKTEKIGKDISYIIIKDNEKEFDIILFTHNKTYETKKKTAAGGESWIREQINTL